MNAVLWIVQGLLAAAFLAAGLMKSTRPIEALSKQMTWVKSVPPGFVRFIGVAELLGAIGLILPMVTNILPWLSTQNMPRLSWTAEEILSELGQAG